MHDNVDSLILDLLEWIGPDPRPYGETVEAWRTSCPRLPVWEQANELGLVRRREVLKARRSLPSRPPGSSISDGTVRSLPWPCERSTGARWGGP